MPTPPTLDATVDVVCDSLASFAMIELASQGLAAAYGSQLPEIFNGVGPAMLFYKRPRVASPVLPRAMGRDRAGFGQRTEHYKIEGCLLVGSRELALPVLQQSAEQWERKVWDAFHKHQQLGGLVQELRTEDCVYEPALKWGDAIFYCILFHWDVEVIVTAQAGL